MILQKILINDKHPLKIAEIYFAIMSVLNDLHLAKKEIQLMAFTTINGGIGSYAKRKEFVKKYDSSLATVGNIISKLNKNNLLIKNKRIIVVNKALLQNFDKGIRMDIIIENVIR